MPLKLSTYQERAIEIAILANMDSGDITANVGTPDPKIQVPHNPTTALCSDRFRLAPLGNCGGLNRQLWRILNRQSRVGLSMGESLKGGILAWEAVQGNRLR